RLAFGAKCVLPSTPGTTTEPAAVGAPSSSSGLSRLASAATPTPPALRLRNVRRDRARSKVSRSIMWSLPRDRLVQVQDHAALHGVRRQLARVEFFVAL